MFIIEAASRACKIAKGQKVRQVICAVLPEGIHFEDLILACNACLVQQAEWADSLGMEGGQGQG